MRIIYIKNPFKISDLYIMLNLWAISIFVNKYLSVLSDNNENHDRNIIVSIQDIVKFHMYEILTL